MMPRARGRILTLEEAPRGARIIVCGGRFFARPLDSYPSAWARRQDARRVERERALLFEVLDLLRPREIAHGAAPGADEGSGEWALDRGCPYQAFPINRPDENGFGRNRRMFVSFKPDGTVAFKGFVGTADMETVTRDAGAWLVRPR